MPLPLIHYLYPSNLSKYLRQSETDPPTWALITGSTDGIGLALAHLLAAHGSNIILHGRNPSKLHRCQSHLAATYPHQNFLTITTNASSFTPQDISHIVATAFPLPLTILINNVGGTSPLSSNFKHFEDTTPKEINALFSLNILFPIHLTLALLPLLQRHPSPTLILNIGSQSYTGMPYAATYSATKGALHAWSRGLAAELYEAGSRVEVTEVVVGATYTQQLVGDENMREGLLMPGAEVMAGSVVRRVGRGHRSVVAYFWHWVVMGVVGVLPVWMVDRILAGALRKSVEGKGV